MSTVNGFGTKYYGWRYVQGRPVEATLWLVAAFLPVLPLRRVRVSVSDMPPEPATFVLVFGSAFHERIVEIERLPFDWRAILKTYLKGWTLTPILILLPLLVILPCVLLIEWFQGREAKMQNPVFSFAVSCVVLVYYGLLLARVLDASAGRRT